jgi:hypothetical protein
MAKTIVKPKHDMAKGADVADPTRASKPTPVSYKYPLAKGLPALPDKLDGDGNSAPLTAFGRNQFSGPSSVSVRDSADMTDFQNLATPKGDDVLKSLQVNGHGDQSGENSAVADLQRKIDTTAYPAAHGMAKRGADSGSPGGTIPATIGATSAQPVRKPGA